MFGLGAWAVSAGIGFIKDLIIDNGEDLVKEGIKKVTGIDLNKKKVSDLTPADIKLINDSQIKIKELDFKELELIVKDRQSARTHNVEIQAAKDWLVRNTGSMLAIFTILTAFVLDILLIVMIVNGQAINPLYTLIQGAMNARAIQVLGFYFGDSKRSADSERK